VIVIKKDESINAASIPLIRNTMREMNTRASAKSSSYCLSVASNLEIFFVQFAWIGARYSQLETGSKPQKSMLLQLPLRFREEIPV
jgi:hypothetical protein